MNTKLWQWVSGIAGSIAVICIIAVGTMWNNQRDLINWRDKQWPLEKQLLLVEQEQMKAQTEVLQNRMDRLEDRK